MAAGCRGTGTPDLRAQGVDFVGKLLDHLSAVEAVVQTLRHRVDVLEAANVSTRLSTLEVQQASQAESIRYLEASDLETRLGIVETIQGSQADVLQSLQAKVAAWVSEASASSPARVGPKAPPPPLEIDEYVPPPAGTAKAAPALLPAEPVFVSFGTVEEVKPVVKTSSATFKAFPAASCPPAPAKLTSLENLASSVTEQAPPPKKHAANQPSSLQQRLAKLAKEAVHEQFGNGAQGNRDLKSRQMQQAPSSASSNSEFTRQAPPPAKGVWDAYSNSVHRTGVTGPKASPGTL